MTRIQQPPPITEAMFQVQVIEYAKLRGWRVAHFRPAMNRRGVWATQMQGDPGFPDLVLAREGQVVFAELKSKRGKVTPDQQAWRWALGAGRPGCSAHIWRPNDCSQIERVLR